MYTCTCTGPFWLLSCKHRFPTWNCWIQSFLVCRHIWMIVLQAGFTHLSPLSLTWISGFVHFNCSLPSPVWMEGHQMKELMVMSACLCAEHWLSHCLCFSWQLYPSGAGPENEAGTREVAFQRPRGLTYMGSV